MRQQREAGGKFGCWWKDIESENSRRPWFARDPTWRPWRFDGNSSPVCHWARSLGSARAARWERMRRRHSHSVARPPRRRCRSVAVSARTRRWIQRRWAWPSYPAAGSFRPVVLPAGVPWWQRWLCVTVRAIVSQSRGSRLGRPQLCSLGPRPTGAAAYRLKSHRCLPHPVLDG